MTREQAEARLEVATKIISEKMGMVDEKVCTICSWLMGRRGMPKTCTSGHGFTGCEKTAFKHFVLQTAHAGQQTEQDAIDIINRARRKLGNLEVKLLSGEDTALQYIERLLK